MTGHDGPPVMERMEAHERVWMRRELLLGDVERTHVTAGVPGEHALVADWDVRASARSDPRDPAQAGDHRGQAAELPGPGPLVDEVGLLDVKAGTGPRRPGRHEDEDDEPCRPADDA